MNSAPIKILLVDDDTDCHALIRDMLGHTRQSNYQLECFNDYDQAREAITQNDYHACLLDYRLGAKNGLDLIRETTQFGNTPPMIVLTGVDDPDLALESIRAGAEDFLHKVQITPDLLERSIRYAIEQKQIKQQLRLMQFSVDSASDMVFWVNSQGLFLYVNDAVCRCLGYTRESLLTMHVFDIDPNFPKERWSEHWNALRQQGSMTFETTHKSRDGRTFPVEIKTNYMSFAGQEYNFAFARDTSEHKQAQQRLRQALMQFEAVIQNVPMVAIQSFDTHGVIRHWNTYSEYVYGLTATEVIGHRFQDILLDDHQAGEFVAMLEQIRTSGEPTSSKEVMYQTINGQMRWMYTVAFPVFDDGRVIEIFCVSVDITELKQAQKDILLAKEQSEHINRQLEASIDQANILAKEAKVSNEAKGTFLANMSHEIRTPLHAIIGFSDILADEHITPEQKKYVHLIQTAGHNLLELINDILDFSRIEADKLDLESKEFSLEKMLFDLKALMEPAALKKHLEFQILPDPNLPSMICTDPARLRQCLVNLINNAIKFTEKGHVRVLVQLEQDQAESVVRFDISDSGIGVVPEAREKIFDMFSQADEGINRKYGGTGLGLAITKKLAAMLGGNVALESEPGIGSTFTLWIPAGVNVEQQTSYGNSESLVSSVRRKPAIPDTFQGHALVVEDNASNQVLMHKLLQKLGIKTTMANDGEQAIEKVIQDDSFDLIFMDMQMPKMNGFEATKILREKQISTPIIALTASAMKGDRERCILAGCDDYLTKPINSNELRRIMNKYMNNESTPDNPPIISELADDPDLCEVAEMFIQELPDTLEKIQQAVEQNDYDALKFLIHSLKGSSGSAGFPTLMEKARQVETKIIQQEMDALKKELDEMNDLFRRARSRADA